MQSWQSGCLMEYSQTQYYKRTVYKIFHIQSFIRRHTLHIL